MDLQKLYTIREFASFLGYENVQSVTIAIKKYTFFPEPEKIITNPNNSKKKFWTIEQMVDTKRKIDEFKTPTGVIRLGCVENKYGERNISIEGFLNNKQLSDFLDITSNQLEKLKLTQVWFPDSTKKIGHGTECFYKKGDAEFIKDCLDNAPKDSKGRLKYEEMNEKYKNKTKQNEMSFLAKNFLCRPYLKMENTI